MKVDKNQPTYPVTNPANGECFSGIPLRLEIASRILAQWGCNHVLNNIDEEDCNDALSLADKLIEKYNETIGE